MTGIEKQTSIVWYAPTRGRRYFSRSAAIKGEATALILKKHPIEPFEWETGGGYDIRYEDPHRFGKMHRRMCRLVSMAARGMAT